MGIENKFRLAGFAHISSRIAAKVAGNKGVRFKVFCVKKWDAFKETRLVKGLGWFVGKIRVDRNIKMFRTTPAKSIAHNFINRKYDNENGDISQSKIQDAIARIKKQKNLEINKDDVADLKKKAEEMAVLAQELEFAIDDEMTHRAEAQEALQNNNAQEVQKYNEGLVQRQIDRALRPGNRGYINTKVDRKLIRMLEPHLKDLQGRFPSRDKMVEMMQKVLEDQGHFFDRNGVDFEDFKRGAEVNDRLLPLNQDKVDNMIAVGFLKDRLNHYLTTTPTSREEDPLVSFFYDNGEELGIPHLYGLDNQTNLPGSLQPAQRVPLSTTVKQNIAALESMGDNFEEKIKSDEARGTDNKY